MAEPLIPDVAVNICHNCIPQAGRLPRQWKQGEALVSVREVPCSGKIDVQYLLHALEDVRGGVCVVACPQGKCRLGQGNHRADVRMSTVRRLLGEIGLEPERAELLHCSSEEPFAKLEQLVKSAAKRIAALPPSPLRKDSEGERPPTNQSSAERGSAAESTTPLQT